MEHVLSFLSDPWGFLLFLFHIPSFIGFSLPSSSTCFSINATEMESIFFSSSKTIVGQKTTYGSHFDSAAIFTSLIPWWLMLKFCLSYLLFFESWIYFLFIYISIILVKIIILVIWALWIKSSCISNLSSLIHFLCEHHSNLFKIVVYSVNHTTQFLKKSSQWL